MERNKLPVLLTTEQYTHSTISGNNNSLPLRKYMKQVSKAVPEHHRGSGGRVVSLLSIHDLGTRWV
jgi:hypothetical protein